MARQFNGPLTADDLAYLRARRPVSHVDALILQYGLATDGGEDLIGELYDPGEHTVEEVNRYLRDAPPEERERILAAERAGKNRSSVGG